VYPEELLEKYKSCTVSYDYIKRYWDKLKYELGSDAENNSETPRHYEVISTWFKAFRDPDVCKDINDIKRLVSYETQAQLVHIIDCSFKKYSSSDECEKIAFSLLEEIYKQCDLAIDWSDANVTLLEIENKMREIENSKKNLKEKMDNAEELQKKLE
jgi:hypothetical protein